MLPLRWKLALNAVAPSPKRAILTTFLRRETVCESTGKKKRKTTFLGFDTGLLAASLGKIDRAFFSPLLFPFDKLSL